MSGLPPDGRYVTGDVPAEMREGADLTPGVDVAAPTSRIENGVDGVEEQARVHVLDEPPAHHVRIDARASR